MNQAGGGKRDGGSLFDRICVCILGIGVWVHDMR